MWYMWFYVVILVWYDQYGKLFTYNVTNWELFGELNTWQITVFNHIANHEPEIFNE